jgi:hypothetical protein
MMKGNKKKRRGQNIRNRQRTIVRKKEREVIWLAYLASCHMNSIRSVLAEFSAFISFTKQHGTFPVAPVA